jgi:hypothetical protein
MYTNLDDPILLSHLDENRKSRLHRVTSLTFYLFENVLTSIDLLKKENEELSKAKDMITLEKYNKSLKKNCILAKFVWPKACLASNLLLSHQKKKKVFTLKKSVGFESYYREKFIFQIERLENVTLHTIPSFSKISQNLRYLEENVTEIKDIQNEINIIRTNKNQIFLNEMIIEERINQTG